jgi:hypothetical protein
MFPVTPLPVELNEVLGNTLGTKFCGITMMQIVQQPHEPHSQKPQQARSHLARHVESFSKSISPVPRYFRIVVILFMQELSFYFRGGCAYMAVSG